MTTAKAILYVIWVNVVILLGLILFFIHGAFQYEIMTILFLYWTLDAYGFLPWKKDNKLTPQQEKFKKILKKIGPIGLICNLALLIFY